MAVNILGKQSIRVKSLRNILKDNEQTENNLKLVSDFAGRQGICTYIISFILTQSWEVGSVSILPMKPKLREDHKTDPSLLSQIFRGL